MLEFDEFLVGKVSFYMFNFVWILYHDVKMSFDKFSKDCQNELDGYRLEFDNKC